MNIIGLDPSYTATGIAWGDGTTCTMKLKGDGRERLQFAYNTFGNLDADLVVVEGYAHGKGFNTHMMGELGGVIRLALTHARIPFLDVQPTQLKKYATGKGNAKKEVVLVEAVRRLGYEGSSTDEADALWLRQIGLALHTPELAVTVPAAHMAALEKL